MTTIITAGSTNDLSFSAYLDDFDATFTASGRGAFSDGTQGDYAVSEAAITDTADTEAQAFVLRDDIVYSMTTHQLSGSVSSVDLGYGVTGTASGGSTVLDLEEVDYSIRFKPQIDDADEVYDLIYDLLGYGDGGLTDGLRSLVAADDIRFIGSAAADVFAGFDNDDLLKGRSGADTLSGGKGADRLLGQKGADTLNGGNGADELSGGSGRDLLKGGKHADTLDGGTGNDKLVGGHGADVFVFSGGNFGRDVVRDFTPGLDVIDLSGATGEAESFDAFLAASTQSGSRVIYDLDGDGANVIVLKDITLDALSADDFLF
ncbi:calcium-binding protein [Tritonibacter horizontis]|uniref:Poly(Beta-D-mannuronate) C5 epimerase 7 n=1 Tax=Tritonibacter horizontis TaxID=1768241 RepID=A0A132BVT7_9RHOB|nr:calcium-binding protein [Tritonibacter horizontis]KUP92316.1 poly(beta-D-mannuronate) C5 epimerase 7 [Tritonibacter horizontis]